jgi:hypothetical protein
MADRGEEMQAREIEGTETEKSEGQKSREGGML